MTAADSPARGAAAGSPADPRRWWVLGVCAACQLLVVLSASVVNIALPQAQQALHISDTDRAWVVTAYTLAVGSLLLLGGRVADYAGRRRVLVIGLLGFAAASAFAGAAQATGVLLAARAVQGGCAALVTPAALSLLSVTFRTGRDRAVAFSVYGAMSAGGGAVGLVLGGVLTQYATWRWCLLLNVPFALVAAVLARLRVPESSTPGERHYDLPGALTVVAGLTALVYALTTAARHGWTSMLTAVLLIASAALLASFVLVEARSTRPLLPLRILASPTRAGALIAVTLAGAGLLGMFLFLTYYLQGTRGYSALTAGLAFLPSSVGIAIATVATGRLLDRAPPRLLLAPGMALAGLGLLWLSRLDLASSFWGHVAPAELLVGIGMGLVLVTASSTVLLGVAPEDAGVASALVNTTQQIGGSLGTALLNSVAAVATAGLLRTRPDTLAVASMLGYRQAFAVAAILLGVGSVVSVILVRARGGTSNQTPTSPSGS